MSAPTNHWKLGLFVVCGLLVGVLVALWIGARSFKKETVRYTTYFDEAVSGLETGSSVSFRGVRIGSVHEIQVAPDRRHVQVDYDLEVSVLQRLGLSRKHDGHVTFTVPDDLRVQLSTAGVTGGKYLKIDFFDIRVSPPPELPFPVPENYIPATASTLKSLEESVLKAIEQLPDVVGDLKVILSQVNTILTDVNSQKLPDQAAHLIARADGVIATLDSKLRDVQAKELSDELRGTLTDLRRVIARLDSDTGLFASLKRTADSVGDVADDARGTGGDLGEALRSVREMADGIRRLVDALERDPDMLLKGRARREPR